MLLKAIVFHWSLGWVNVLGFELNLMEIVWVNDILHQHHIDYSWEHVHNSFLTCTYIDREMNFQPVESVHAPPFWLYTPGDWHQNQKRELESDCSWWFLLLSTILTWHPSFPYSGALITILPISILHPFPMTWLLQ